MKKLKNSYVKYKDPNRIINNRFKILIGIVILITIILSINLFYVQIVKGNHYKNILDTLTGKIVEGPTAPRGYIYDRNHKLIVDNVPVKIIYYKKDKKISASEEIKLANKISEYIEIDYTKLTNYDLKNFWIKNNPKESYNLITPEEYQKLEERKITRQEIEKLKRDRIPDEELIKINKEAAYIYYLMNKGYSYSEKIIKSVDVSDNEYAIIGVNSEYLNGFNVRLDWNRNYIYGETFKSILGSVSNSETGIPNDLKETYLEKGYSLDDRVGISYLEYQYDDYLKGTKNKYKLNKFNELELIEQGRKGKDIVLTIDIELQRQVEEIIINELIKAKSEPNTTYYNRSFVIITDPKTGEILAMSGKQIIDNNGEYKIIDYTPGILTSPVVVGSIIKGASHIVGYNTGALQIGEKRYDTCVKLRGAPTKCSWKSLGLLDDLTALKHSSNTFQFYTALKVAGVNYFYDMPFKPNSNNFETYRNTFKEFGLGVKTGIDLPIESLGYKGTKEVGGLLLDFSIGQYDNYTPIQLSQYITTIANNGVRIKPYLLKEVYDGDNKIYEAKREELNKVNPKQEYLDRVKLGFKMVMEYGGTGSGYIDHSFNPAGKTGTSQSFVDSDLDGNIDKETITNTFAAYVPYDNPVVTFTVISPDIYYSETNSSYQTNVNKRISKQVSQKYFDLYN